MLDYDDRRREFHENYGNDCDPAFTLVHLVRAAGDFLAQIVGDEAADSGMKTVIGSMGCEDEDWRSSLETNENGAFSEWPLGNRLHDLTAFALYGIEIVSDESTLETTTPATRIAQDIAEAEKFLAKCPLELWLGSKHPTELETIVAAARCRFELDLGNPVDPKGLAVLGGISDSRMRGLFSGTAAVMKKLPNGTVDAADASAWLETRPNFHASIWQNGIPSDEDSAGSDPAEEEDEGPYYLVPQASDGSIFHPDLKRKDGYQIGRAGEERWVEDYFEALDALLNAQRPAIWRRPSEGSGKFGRVTEVGWVRRTAKELGLK